MKLSFYVYVMDDCTEENALLWASARYTKTAGVKAYKVEFEVPDTIPHVVGIAKEVDAAEP